MSVGDHLVVWVNTGDGTINAVPKQGGEVVQLAGPTGARFVAIGSDGVCYATSTEIWRVPCSIE